MGGQVTPFLRTIFTDMSGCMINHQMLGRCAKQEMNYMDCLEGYGWDRGIKKCKHLLDDFKECQTNNKQFLRFMAIRRERDRQIRCGMIDPDKAFSSPRMDSY